MIVYVTVLTVVSFMQVSTVKIYSDDSLMIVVSTT